MSLPELDLKKDEKSKLILSVAQKLKLAKKPWDDFAKIYHKYSQALLAVTAIGKQVTEQLNTIGALHKGDVGENITRLSGVQAAIDQKLEAISNCIEIELVTPIQNSLAPDQQSVGNFEKEFVKNSENIGSQLKKIEAQTKKVGKKGNNDDLMTVMSQFKNKITELDNWKSDSLKRVFLLERKRFCELLSHCCKVSQAELDLAQTISTYDTLLPQWNATVATAEVLPDELLKKFTTQGGLMQLTTAESASVQLANTTDQRIQNMHRVNEFAPPSDLPPPPPGSSGGYDSYEQPSYDNGDYSNNGYSNDYSSNDYSSYDAPDDVPPPPMSTPPPPPMSSPPPPPVKKMNNGPPSGPPSFTPRTPRDTMPPNSMPPPPPVKKMGGPPPGPPSFTPPPPMTNPAPPKITPRASQQMSPGPPKYAPPPPNVKAAAPPPPMNTPPPPPMSRTPPMPPKNAGGPPTPPSVPKSMSGSGGAPPPPPPAPKAPGPPPPPPVSSSSKKSKAKDDDDDHHSGGGERNALLSSIHSFKKGGLKKAVTNDRSGPNLTQPKGGAASGSGRAMPMMY